MTASYDDDSPMACISGMQSCGLRARSSVWLGSAPKFKRTWVALTPKFAAAMCKAVPFSYSLQGVSTSIPYYEDRPSLTEKKFIRPRDLTHLAGFQESVEYWRNIKVCCIMQWRHIGPSTSDFEAGTHVNQLLSNLQEKINNIDNTGPTGLLIRILLVSPFSWKGTYFKPELGQPPRDK